MLQAWASDPNTDVTSDGLYVCTEGKVLNSQEAFLKPRKVRFQCAVEFWKLSCLVVEFTMLGID